MTENPEDKLTVPKGAYLAECYVYRGHLVVCGCPEPDDETHNCDEQGCISTSHVLVRLKLQRGWQVNALDAAKAGKEAGDGR